MPSPAPAPAANPGSATARPPSLAFSLLYGALALGLVSVAAYSIWAFKLLPEKTALYAAVAAVYLLLGGFALSRLARGRLSAPRFAALFAAAFLAYALLWCAVYFGLRGKYLADLWAALLGLIPLVALFRFAFGATQPPAPRFLVLFLAVFALHSLGYYAGDYLYAAVRGTTGRLLWGAAHGLGFGAGLGYLLHRVQTAPKNRLAAPPAA